MSRSALISLIAVVLVGFILFKGAVDMVCAPTQPNAVANVVSNVLTAPAPAPVATNSVATNPDPFSWGPFIQQLVKLITKFCPV